MEPEDARIARMLDRYFDCVRGSVIMTSPANDVPPAMLDSALCPWAGYVYWAPVRSTLTEGVLDGFEREAGVALPRPYRALLLDRHFDSLQLLGIEFAAHSIDHWRSTLLELYQAAHDRTVARGFVPFASDRLADAGYVCFDTRIRSEADDCPVVLWDWDRVGEQDEVRPLFSSSIAMFDAFDFVLREGFPWRYSQAAEGTPALLAQRELMRKFLAVDPQGAGATGLSWWTGWGVDP